MSESNPKNPKTKALVKPLIFNEFAMWMALPEPMREIKTQGEFAKKFGVHQDTLSDWKKKPEFWKIVEQEWNHFGRTKTANVIAKFYKTTMTEGKTSDIKLWLQYFLDWSEKIDSKVNHSGALKIIHTYRNSKDDPTSNPTSNPQVESKDDKTD